MTKFTPESTRQMYLMEDMEKRGKMIKISKLADELNNIMGRSTVRFCGYGL